MHACGPGQITKKRIPERRNDGQVSVLDIFKDADMIYNIEYTLLKEEKSGLISFEEIEEPDLPDGDLYLDEEDKEDYINFFAQDTNDNFSLPCTVYLNTLQNVHVGKGVFSDSIIMHQESGSVEEMDQNGYYKMKDKDLYVQSAIEDEEVRLENFFRMNAPSLLVSYIRAQMAYHTAQAGFPAFHIPFIDFSKDVK